MGWCILDAKLDLYISKGTKKEPIQHDESTSYNFFYKFQEIATSMIINRSKDENGKTVNWLFIKSLKYFKGEPGASFYRYEYNDEFCKIAAFRRGRPISNVCHQHTVIDFNSA